MLTKAMPLTRTKLCAKIGPPSLSLVDSRAKLGRVFSGGVPPDSIPNSEVKPACGKNSAEVALCQNSTMPPFLSYIPDPRIVHSILGFLFLRAPSPAKVE